MKHNSLIFCVLFLASACTIQQQNGNELHFQGSPLLVGNQWETKQKFAMNSGDRICTVSAGEMNVGQRARGSTINYEISTSTPISPGDHYRVIYNNDVHETSNGSAVFNATESKAIVADLMKGGIIYTEIQQMQVYPAGREFERIGNKISLDDFAGKFQECKRFVTHPGLE
jgi:hypothetical protein